MSGAKAAGGQFNPDAAYLKAATGYEQLQLERMRHEIEADARRLTDMRQQQENLARAIKVAVRDLIVQRQARATLVRKIHGRHMMRLRTRRVANPKERRKAWPLERTERLQALLADGLTYSQAAKVLGCSRVAVAGAVRRHIQKTPDPRKHGLPRQDGFWTEEKLTETYTERKQRLAVERHA